MAPSTIVSSPETWFINEADGWPVDYCIVTSRLMAPSTIASSPETWFINEADGWPCRLLYRHRRPGLLTKRMDGPSDYCIVTGDLVC